MPAGLAPENPQDEINSLLEDKTFCADLLRRLERELDGAPLRFMEVCGTHTVSLFQSGLRALLPKNIVHLSGPGCPVCVTHESEISAFLSLARLEGVILATFGDLIRVPGPGGKTLKHARSEGADIRVVYSPLEAVKLAADNPGREVVFPGVGFETTAPLVAAAILAADSRDLANFSVLSLHKLVPPALRALLDNADNGVDAFLLPGHVATVTGPDAFNFLAAEYKKPAAIGGFEPADILLALIEIAKQAKTGEPRVVNAYPRAVAANGNPRAREIMSEVFSPIDGQWRGLGKIKDSGLRIKDKYAAYDAGQKFIIEWSGDERTRGCQCGQVLSGKISPVDCPLFGKICSPASPVGPCMVSTEGSCAAYYKYGVA